MSDVTYTGTLPAPAPRSPAVNTFLAAMKGSDNLGLAVYPNGSGKLIAAHDRGQAVEDIKVGAAAHAVLGRPLSQIHHSNDYATFELSADQVATFLPIFAHEPQRVFSVGGSHDTQGAKAAIAQLQSARSRA